MKAIKNEIVRELLNIEAKAESQELHEHDINDVIHLCKALYYADKVCDVVESIKQQGSITPHVQHASNTPPSYAPNAAKTMI